MTNLLGLAWKLTEAERKLITEAIRRHDPEKPVIDYNDLAMIGLLSRERVIAALWLYGTNAALDLALNLGVICNDDLFALEGRNSVGALLTVLLLIGIGSASVAAYKGMFYVTGSLAAAPL